MLAKGEEPERRSFLPWHALRQALARARLPRWVRWPRRHDFYVPQPVLKLWQKLPPAPAWLTAFFTWFAKTHHRNMQIIGGWICNNPLADTLRVGVLETVDRLIVVAHNTDMRLVREQFDYALFGSVQVLKLVNENMLELRALGSNGV